MNDLRAPLSHATMRPKTGDRVCVDGGKGLVKIIESKETATHD